MRIREVHLQDFRNIPLAHVELGTSDAFFLGNNAQGKTSFLEACGLLTALRSFRTSDLRHLIRDEGSGEARLRFVLDHESRGECEIEVVIKKTGRELYVDGERVRRQQDFVGQYPVVPICSDDIELLRGAPGARRRFLDLLLAGTGDGYFEALRAYTRVLKDRNALLKKGRGGLELAAFDLPLAQAGAILVATRIDAVDTLNRDLQDLYQAYSPADETVEVRYQASIESTDKVEYREALSKGLKRDMALGSTLSGPHRDDLQFFMGGRKARDYGSEGQQRGYVLALKLAAVLRFRRILGATPVVLADDVLLELDEERRRLFWNTLDEDIQVIASGTQKPLGGRKGEWQFWDVKAGLFNSGKNGDGA